MQHTHARTDIVLTGRALGCKRFPPSSRLIDDILKIFFSFFSFQFLSIALFFTNKYLHEILFLILFALVLLREALICTKCIRSYYTVELAYNYSSVLYSL